jgi:hypothetical protein
MIDIKSIISRLESVENSKSLVLEDGTHLISKLPARDDGLFQEAYQHEIYPSLSEDEIFHLEGLISRKIPDNLKDYYRICNGMSIFSGSLSIRGLRENYTRDVDVRLPISLESGNTKDRPMRKINGKDEFIDNSGQIRFGFFSYSGTELMMLISDEKRIYAVPRYKDGPILYEWESFESMLNSEIERMSNEYIKRESKVDPLNPIAGPWGD